MLKSKIFIGDDPEKLEAEVNRWLKADKVKEIIRSNLAVKQVSFNQKAVLVALTIFFDDERK